MTYELKYTMCVNIHGLFWYCTFVMLCISIVPGAYERCVIVHMHSFHIVSDIDVYMYVLHYISRLVVDA